MHAWSSLSTAPPRVAGGGGPPTECGARARGARTSS